MKRFDFEYAAAGQFYENPENLQPAGPARLVPKKPSRGADGPRVPVIFPAAMIEAVKSFADQDDLTVSSWIRRVVAQEVERRSDASAPGT